MIHPMWHDYMVASIGSAYEATVWDGKESHETFYNRVAHRAATLADVCCAEYDKRDKATTGSPYRS